MQKKRNISSVIGFGQYLMKMYFKEGSGDSIWKEKKVVS